eukprot:PhF_6_TR38671/c0_g1_i1/m.57849
MDFFDPHFHLFDIDSGIHSAEMLGPDAYRFYDLNQYESSVNAMTLGGLKLNPIGGVFVEAMAPNVHKEAVWISDILSKAPSKRKYGVSAGVDFTLPQPEVFSYLRSLKTDAHNFIGCRQIVNFEPTWANVKEEWFGAETPAADTWRDNFLASCREGLLPTYDIQCNPHQLFRAVPRVLQHVPSTVPLILDHIGTFKNTQDETQYRQALEAYSKLPNANVKVSMLWYVGDSSKALRLVQEVVQLFGENRCMFATNAPVDEIFSVKTGGETRTFQVADEFLTTAAPSTQKALLSGTAQSVYRF